MTINRGWRLLFGAAAVVALGLVLASCCLSGRHREVSAEEFLDLARAPIGSAYNTSFIGATGGRAYLSVWSAMPSSVGGGEDVCSCALSELPADAVAQINEGRNPWAK
jgi:hypothetical protein